MGEPSGRKELLGVLVTREVSAACMATAKDGFTVELLRFRCRARSCFLPPEPEGEEGKAKPAEEYGH